jgi:sugar (pentulose or hexulose) kinase
MSYLLALDAGTGSVRAVIFDLQGNQIAVGQAEWKHLSVENVPGSMEFDLDTNWRLACQCIHQALERAHLSAADISAGLGIALVPASASQIRLDNVVYLDLLDRLEESELVLVYRRIIRSEVVKKFLLLVRADE